MARAEARAPRAGVVSSISRSHSPCQEGAVATDPSMSDISYIDVETRRASPHKHAHSGSRRDPDSTHSTRKDTWYCNFHTPPTLHHDWVNMAEVQLQIATYEHTLAARIRNLCMANASLPLRGSRVQCAGDCTSGIRFGRAAPPHWFGSVPQRLCPAHV